jgi:hypothetical protein
MTEESPQSFPLPNPADLVYVYIESELKKAGIGLKKIETLDRTVTVTTDTKVPEEIMSSIRQHVGSKGFAINFLT